VPDDKAGHRLVWKTRKGYGIPSTWGKILDVNLDELTLDDLKALQKSVAKAIQTFEARQKANALAAPKRPRGRPGIL
jgi:hypothetical protein